MAAIITTDIALLRLLQLSSASLPVGAYSFSQGLEYAVEQGWVTTAPQTADWLRLVMGESIARVDLPLLQRLMIARQQKHSQQFVYWNATLLACRETAELLLTETAMGEALARLLKQLAIPLPTLGDQKIGFVAAFAVAADHWNINPKTAAVGYLWSWLESQIAAATKLIPLGQTAAQKLLMELGEDISGVSAKADAIADADIGSSLPGLAMASSWHEAQYTRLFRS